ncbi:MAG: hypothetical protein KDJ52_13325, partial [Anaerolineae bacterium]|nr:hypothetical protein [Anaerolineae bacterium]
MTVQTSPDEVMPTDPEVTPPPPPADAIPAPIETSLTPRRITFPNKNSAVVVTPPPQAEASEILAALNLENPSAVLVVVGDTQGLDETAHAQLVQLFSRGVARAAASTNAVIIDGGRNSGIMALTGKSVADRGYQSPLVGVAPAGKIIEPGATASGADNGREPLDPHHTYFVLTDGRQWGDENDVMFELAETLGKEVPVIMVLVNGSDFTTDQVIRAIRNNWPVIVIKGSGGLADNIASLRQMRPGFIPDADLAEIIIDGNLHIFQLDGAIGAFERLLEQLASNREGEGMETLELAWKMFAMYDANANRQQDSYNRGQTWALILGVVGTLLVLIQKQMELSGDPLAETVAEQMLKFVIL